MSPTSASLTSTTTQDGALALATAAAALGRFATSWIWPKASRRAAAASPSVPANTTRRSLAETNFFTSSRVETTASRSTGLEVKP